MEELGLPYNLRHVWIEEGENRQPEFLRLNPHGRIPVLVDDSTGITLFEFSTILLYLANKSGRLLSTELWTRLGSDPMAGVPCIQHGAAACR